MARCCGCRASGRGICAGIDLRALALVGGPSGPTLSGRVAATGHDSVGPEGPPTSKLRPADRARFLQTLRALARERRPTAVPGAIESGGRRLYFSIHPSSRIPGDPGSSTPESE
ncbi:DUF6053 domain-containing protein [Lysobacter enzymogenes]|uniref:DUF6053 domain-containing protein n=1 Tax=Lysobacter enzymogenes TaxID=69 RepID=UPI003D189B26